MSDGSLSISRRLYFGVFDETQFLIKFSADELWRRCVTSGCYFKIGESVNIEELLNHSGPFRDEKATRGNMSNKRQKALFLAFNSVQ